MNFKSSFIAHKNESFGLITAFTFVVASTIFSSEAEGAVIITGQEIRGDVVFSYSGSIDTTGFSAPNPNIAFGNDLNPSTGGFTAGQSDNNAPLFQNISISGPSNFGSGGRITGIASGTPFGFSLIQNWLQLPNSSGSEINGALTFLGTNFNALGVNSSQSYTWNLPNNDNITLEFAPPIPVPEPNMILGSVVVLGVGAIMRKKRDTPTLT
ncbi:MAG: PEP-CTERM sorting domain-containing protein [Cyanobacterium sp. T60_A2020_053]|nr:PEP-CTERM sorting domain-containing protein [Cyanobacterium sp. T60_A2020_053]